MSDFGPTSWIEVFLGISNDREGKRWQAGSKDHPTKQGSGGGMIADGLCNALLQVADLLNNAATGLMICRVLNQKDVLENMVLTNHGDKKHPSTRKCCHDFERRMLEDIRKPARDRILSGFFCPVGAHDMTLLIQILVPSLYQND